MNINLSPVKEYVQAQNLKLFGFSVMTDEGIHSYEPGNGNPLNNSYSVTKSYTATAIGMLWEKGLLSLDEPIVDILKGEGIRYQDKNWEKVTVRHALSHKMGIARGYLDIDVEDIYAYGTTDFLEVAFREPLPHAPGDFYRYSDAAYYLLSRVFAARAKEKMDNFLMRELLVPMRVREAAWSRCPMHYPMGATGLYIRSSDMVKLGYLYANGGIYDGKRLLSEEWIREDQSSQFAFQKANDQGLLGKGGMLGQMLVYSPSGRYAAAWHSYGGDKHAKALTEILNSIIKE